MLSHSVGQSANVKSSIQECWRFCPHVSTDLGDDKCFNPQTKHSLSNHTPSYEWESVRGLSEDGYTSRSLGPSGGGGGVGWEGWVRFCVCCNRGWGVVRVSGVEEGKQQISRKERLYR